MGEFSPIHWLIVLAIIVLLFGGKKIPEVMRGLGEGIRSFKDGMNGPHPSTPAANPPANPPAATPAAPATTTTEEKK
jgi:sec-independent protein translocase protein TatA